MTLTARVAGPDDHATFTRLFPALGVPSPPASLAEFTSDMLPRVLMLDDGGEPFAYVSWQIYGRLAHVDQLVVDERARGRGAGRALLEAVRARVVAAGCTGWHLNVKRDNAAAIRLYERCGMTPQLEGRALRLRWAQVRALPGAGGEVEAVTPDAGDDAAIAARFGFEETQIADVRAHPGHVSVALREGEALVGFAAFDPVASRAYLVRLDRPELAGPLLAALHARALAGGPDTIHLMVKGNPGLAEALEGVGAELLFEVIQMGAPL